MSEAAKAREQARKARARLRILSHPEQVTRNVSRTCRFFAISRTLFYVWRARYRQDGLAACATAPDGRGITPSRHPPTSSP